MSASRRRGLSHASACADGQWAGASLPPSSCVGLSQVGGSTTRQRVLTDSGRASPSLAPSSCVASRRRGLSHASACADGQWAGASLPPSSCIGLSQVGGSTTRQRVLTDRGRAPPSLAPSSCVGLPQAGARHVSVCSDGQWAGASVTTP